MIRGVNKKYKIVSQIGVGGMAKIWLAYDRYAEKDVVIKILHYDMAANIVSKKRFKSELDLTTQINSDFVVKIIDYKFDDEIQYIVMEHISGVTLRDHIKSRVNLTNDEVVNIAKDIASGLVAIHKQKIVHRDLKSLNILIDNLGRAKIIDLGIAITYNSERLTKTNNVIGSAHYLAPEIIEGHQPTASADIYALGVLMYEMLTGAVPFNDPDYQVIASQHLKNTLPNIFKKNPGARQSVVNIITKAMAKNPRDRYQNATIFYKDLNTALSNERLHEKPWSFKWQNTDRRFSDLLNHKFYWVWLLSGILFVIVITMVLLLVFI